MSAIDEALEYLRCNTVGFEEYAAAIEAELAAKDKRLKELELLGIDRRLPGHEGEAVSEPELFDDWKHHVETWRVKCMEAIVTSADPITAAELHQILARYVESMETRQPWLPQEDVETLRRALETLRYASLHYGRPDEWHALEAIIKKMEGK